jgi:hypothetical protein
MPVEAKIGSNVCGKTQVVDWNGVQAYRLLIDPNSTGCDLTGKTIRIEVDGELRGYIHYDNSDTSSITLDTDSVYWPFRIYLPGVSR